MKLISMVDFVLTRDIARSNSENVLCEIENYANFLKQPLTLGMFIPCDEIGNILRDPIPEHLNYKAYMTTNKFEILQENYNKAKEKVLFKDLWVKDGNIIFPMHGYLSWDKLNLCTIDNLTYKGVNLTENALKQIGL